MAESVLMVKSKAFALLPSQSFFVLRNPMCEYCRSQLPLGSLPLFAKHVSMIEKREDLWYNQVSASLNLRRSIES